MINIAFQGSLGAYSHAAILSYFKEEARATGLELSEQVIEAVLSEDVAAGILPVENSIVGNVALNTDLLYKNDLNIIGEHYQPIQHCLLGPKGSTIESIRQVHSHPVALAQCRDFLNMHKIKPIPESDTAGSSARLGQEQKAGEAAISSEICAELYDLEVLARDIQQTEQNYTRFVIFVRGDHSPVEFRREKTSLAFRTQHSPGALLECLQVFAKYGVNLTKLESRPVPENPFQYIFYVDFLGDTHSENISRCLTALRPKTRTLKVLGCYPQAKISF